MADLNPTATNIYGTISSGDNSNPVFRSPVQIGDLTYVDVSPPVGYQADPTGVDYIVFVSEYGTTVDTSAIWMSLERNGTYGNKSAEGLQIPNFDSTTRIWLKAIAECDHPILLMPGGDGVFVPL